MTEATFANRYIPKAQIINDALNNSTASGGGRSYFPGASRRDQGNARVGSRVPQSSTPRFNRRNSRSSSVSGRGKPKRPTSNGPSSSPIRHGTRRSFGPALPCLLPPSSPFAFWHISCSAAEADTHGCIPSTDLQTRCSQRVHIQKGGLSIPIIPTRENAQADAPQRRLFGFCRASSCVPHRPASSVSTLYICCPTICRVLPRCRKAARITGLSVAKWQRSQSATLVRLGSRLSGSV